MKGRVFVDSNILVYAHDLDAGRKHSEAVARVRHLWKEGTGAVSTQVLQEFYVTVTRKIAQPLSRATAREIVRNYSFWPTETILSADVLRASEIEETHQVGFWDALIIAAAAKSGASILLSEDLNNGQRIAGVVIENPFM